MDSNTDLIAVEDIGSVRRIILDRPKQRNAQSQSLLQSLDRALQAAQADASVNVVVIAANGEHFSAGHDLKEAQEKRSRFSVEERWQYEQEHYFDYCMRIYNLPKPTIAEVRREYLEQARAWGAEAAVTLDGDEIAGMTFHHVADTVGGAEVARAARHMQRAGKIRTVATLPIPPEGLPTEPEFMFYHADGERLARIIEDVASGKVTMPVAHRLALSDAAEAHRLMEGGGLSGRIVLHP
ncbi:enoyl-CoA hydratase-related protein [Sphingobium sp. DEHP117]|uniref:enoyl-CoA hydratase-related protein n=1 Tax=Sphingobium sp. DEHP117 TaxID=2993436 RepID=UPI0027D5165F|nr:enoyl-CoA hydratase-related protein [Sphingobium sp. DEHP117]MDQ4419258.1 enoyl-CoA hydratase-related protein [Sphingobium sp. DEHP117]